MSALVIANAVPVGIWVGVAVFCGCLGVATMKEAPIMGLINIFLAAVNAGLAAFAVFSVIAQ